MLIHGAVVSAAANGGWPPDFPAWRPADWGAVGTCVTALVAIVAGIVAWRQLGEARRLRFEQAQPYVVAYMEGTPDHAKFVDLVVRNFGSTAATDVRIKIDPTPRNSFQGVAEDIWVPECIPVLVPGQEWRSLWDFTPQRVQAGLPDRHESVVTYMDTRANTFTTRSILDWAAYRGRMSVTTYGVHEVAEALREIDKTIKQSQESIHGGLTVFVRDGDAKDQREQEQREVLRAAGRAQHQDTDLVQDE